MGKPENRRGALKLAMFNEHTHIKLRDIELKNNAIAFRMPHGECSTERSQDIYHNQYASTPSGLAPQFIKRHIALGKYAHVF